jgi:hypothetical protein
MGHKLLIVMPWLLVFQNRYRNEKVFLKYLFQLLGVLGYHCPRSQHDKGTFFK